MLRILAVSMLTVALLAAPVAGQEWDVVTEESQKLTADDGEAGDSYGYSVAVSGDLLVVGALYNDDGADDAGSVYLYRYDFDEEDWVEEQKLMASDAAVRDYFGLSVACFRDLVIVGAYGNDDDGQSSGSAYIFRYDSDEEEWVEEQKLTASDAALNDRFGISVSVLGNVAVVGAPGDDDDGSTSGSAYVFRYDSDEEEWVEEEKLTASDAGTDAYFGRTVVLAPGGCQTGRYRRRYGSRRECGKVLLVTAYGDDENGTASGAAYIFRYDPDEEEEEWDQEQKLTASDGQLGDRFGFSAAMSGDVALIGAADDNDGSAYIFRYNRGDRDWIQEEKLTASDGAGSDRFGVSVALQDDVALVGSYFDDDDGTNSGSAYLFRYLPSSTDDTEEWVEEQKLAASDAATFDLFGISVALSQSWAAVGAIWDDDNGTDSGSTYTFDRRSTFKRGDADGNGSVVALMDALFLLEWAYLGGDEPPCMSAADADDDGRNFALGDAIHLLRWAFLGGEELPAPGTSCGKDPTEDDLGCETEPPGCE